ncbi:MULTISPECIES: methyltransferase [unclassified Roseitalea]|uniref:tRNA1(Val) (adenine(37)-N6)-methyltransferase n=1 Tax=unclassified Roseitalea TaxID=2639107 RepID=UPI0027401366|nr:MULTISPECIES: methyltransferase [unclassified Roseitalea]
MSASDAATGGIATTTDAFHRGGFLVVQPARGHHRSGLDAMLLAACVEDGFAGTLADLGAGAGAAGLAVLNRCPKARAVLVENDPVMGGCLRATLRLEHNAHLAGRARIVEADLTATGKARAAAGLADRHFDRVIANPPFNDPRDRVSPRPGRASAHVIDAETMTAWMRTAAAICRPGGRLALIVRPSMLAHWLSALEGRFGAIAIRAVHPRTEANANRVLIGAVRGSRARMTILPSLTVHANRGHTLTERAEALTNGRAALPMSG